MMFFKVNVFEVIAGRSTGAKKTAQFFFNDMVTAKAFTDEYNEANENGGTVIRYAKNPVKWSMPDELSSIIQELAA